ncbi:ferredoxin [Patescibacteria group bacterium]|nr:ferredoxin [Patescibacteria group bacterium]
MNNLKPKDPQNPSGPVIIHGYKIYINRNTCIGCGTCAGVSPKAFTLDGEGKSVIIDTADQETIETIIMAAQACPVKAITIENEKGEMVFPK